MDYMEIFSQVMIIISVLTIFVNIITEVVKNTFATVFNTTARINAFVLAMSVAITVGSFIAYCQYKTIEMVWYYIVGFVIIGIMVAYSAMFGYDKLISYFSSVTSDD